MTLTQKLCFFPVMLSLAVVLILQHLLADRYDALGIAKFGVNSLVFLTAMLIPKPTRDHRILGLAFIFVYLADFFFVLLGALPGFDPETPWIKLAGLSVFTLGYLCFVRVAATGARWRSGEWLAALSILAVAVPVGLRCLSTMREGQAVFFWLFVPFVSFVGWMGVGALARGVFRVEIRRLIAVAGFLFFLSEMAFAIGAFTPGLTRNTPWVGNLIWITYIPAWALMVQALALPTWRSP